MSSSKRDSEIPAPSNHSHASSSRATSPSDSRARINTSASKSGGWKRVKLLPTALLQPSYPGEVDEVEVEKAREARRVPIGPEISLEHSLAGPYTRKTAPVPVSDLSDSPDSDHPFSGSGTADEPYLVDWQTDEQANPLKWRKGFRWGLTAHLAINCLCPVFTASAYVGGVEDMLVKFYPLSQEVALLGVSLYVLGTAFGPLVLAPLSELLGRRSVFIYAFPIFIFCCLGGAVAKNIPGILVLRLIAGIAGSGQLAIIGGQVQDLWTAEERVVPGGLASLTPLLGPVIGPVVSGFVAENVGYKPIFWIEFAFGAILYITWIFFVPETYPPTLLRRKAERLQQLADNAGTNEHFISKYDVHRKSAMETLGRAMFKPFELLFREVMVFALSVYIAIIYGILYLLFTAYPYIFQFGRGWSIGLTGLALIGIGIGMIFGFLLGKYQVKFYLQARASLPAGEPVPPEVRLKLGCFGAILIPISLFAFAWSSLPQVPWILPILFSIPFGAGYIIVFTAIMLYLIDAYTIFAASALAANTVMRALFGAAFPLFGGYLYRNLGVGWAGTLLAFLSLACLPLPYLFIRYGPYLRRHSKYIPGKYAQTMPKQTQGQAGAINASSTHNSERTLAEYDEEYKKFSPSMSPVLPDPDLPDPRISMDSRSMDESEKAAGVVIQSKPVPSVSASESAGTLRMPISPSIQSLQSPTSPIAPHRSEAVGTPISARFLRTSPTTPSPLRNTGDFSLRRDPPIGRSVAPPPPLHIHSNPSARASTASFRLHSPLFAPSPRLELGLGSPSLRDTLSGRGWLVGSSMDLTVPTEDGWRDYEQSLHESSRDL